MAYFVFIGASMMRLEHQNSMNITIGLQLLSLSGMKEDVYTSIRMII